MYRYVYIKWSMYIGTRTTPTWVLEAADFVLIVNTHKISTPGCFYLPDGCLLKLKGVLKKNHVSPHSPQTTPVSCQPGSNNPGQVSARAGALSHTPVLRRKRPVQWIISIDRHMFFRTILPTGLWRWHLFFNEGTSRTSMEAQSWSLRWRASKALDTPLKFENRTRFKRAQTRHFRRHPLVNHYCDQCVDAGIWANINWESRCW